MLISTTCNGTFAVSMVHAESAANAFAEELLQKVTDILDNQVLSIQHCARRRDG